MDEYFHNTNKEMNELCLENAYWGCILEYILR